MTVTVLGCGRGCLLLLVCDFVVSLGLNCDFWVVFGGLSAPEFLFVFEVLLLQGRFAIC